MAKLFVIAGHGAGDPGAIGNGYKEADLVRKLATKLKEYGGDDVQLGDFNRNYYADNGITTLTLPLTWNIIELHMDASDSKTAKGGHVIIYGGYTPDEYDNALAKLMVKKFPGRANTIVGRYDLANPNRAVARGYNYRLVECGFITHAEDVKTFNKDMDEIAKEILKCFYIKPKESKPAKVETVKKPTKSIEAVAKEVIAGKWGNGSARKKALTDAGYNYSKVQDKVNELLNAKPVKQLKSLTEIAKEVINGKWGNGEARKKKLTNAGYDYGKVQAKVNELLK